MLIMDNIGGVSDLTFPYLCYDEGLHFCCYDKYVSMTSKIKLQEILPNSAWKFPTKLII